MYLAYISAFCGNCWIFDAGSQRSGPRISYSHCVSRDPTWIWSVLAFLTWRVSWLPQSWNGAASQQVGDVRDQLGSAEVVVSSAWSCYLCPLWYTTILLISRSSKHNSWISCQMSSLFMPWQLGRWEIKCPHGAKASINKYWHRPKYCHSKGEVEIQDSVC